MKVLLKRYLINLSFIIIANLLLSACNNAVITPEPEIIPAIQYFDFVPDLSFSKTLNQSAEFSIKHPNDTLIKNFSLEYSYYVDPIYSFIEYEIEINVRPHKLSIYLKKPINDKEDDDKEDDDKDKEDDDKDKEVNNDDKEDVLENGDYDLGKLGALYPVENVNDSKENNWEWAHKGLIKRFDENLDFDIDFNLNEYIKPETQYYGLRIAKNDSIYFGWFRMEVTADSIIIFDYAYSTKNKLPISAGQTE